MREMNKLVANNKTSLSRLLIDSQGGYWYEGDKMATESRSTHTPRLINSLRFQSQKWREFLLERDLSERYCRQAIICFLPSES